MKRYQRIANDDVSGLIENVHRIGKVVEGRNRLIRVILSSEDCKDRVLREARQLRNASEFKNVYVNPDLTLRQRQEGKRLREELKRRRELGEDVVLRHGSIASKSGNFQ